jgi:O-antigen ligase
MFLMIFISFIFVLRNQDYFGHTISNYQTFYQTDNEMPFISMACVSVSFYLDETTSSKISKYTYFICLTSFFLLLRQWVGSGFPILFIVLGYIYFDSKLNIHKRINASLVLLTYIIIYIMLTFGFFAIFNFIIVGILKKDLTLSYRTLIWADSLKNILMSPLYGYGMDSNGAIVINKFLHPVYNVFTTTASHNYFLEVTLQTGFLGLTIIILFLYSLIKPSIFLLKIKEKTTVGLIIFIFFVFLASMFNYAIYHVEVYIPLLILYYAPNHMILMNTKNIKSINYEVSRRKKHVRIN